jgi:citrate lyase subunit beta/citryl-CoA lyase
MARWASTPANWKPYDATASFRRPRSTGANAKQPDWRDVRHRKGNVAVSILRTLLFAPATSARHVEKALSGATGADGVILDLEDAVANAEKPGARHIARAVIEARGTPERGPLAYVRVNGLTTPFAYDDLCAVVCAGLDGIVVPKIESSAQLLTADWLLRQLERAQGLAEGAIDLMPIIETAAGIAHLAEIATATPRVKRLNFGAGDYSLDTAMTWTAGHEGILWARIGVVNASRTAGLESPVDTVYANLDDMEGFSGETQQAKRLGFQGKACIHPKQVGVVNAIFTPSADEVARARRIVEAFGAAEAAGIASLTVDGQFVDYPIVYKARRTLEIAARISSDAPRT